jgi:hypothetical protein
VAQFPFEESIPKLFDNSWWNPFYLGHMCQKKYGYIW